MNILLEISENNSVLCLHMLVHFWIRYMSGVTLLSADSKIQHAVEVSLIRANYFSNTYWVIAVGVPKQLEGDHRLAMKLMRNSNFNNAKVIFIWLFIK